MEVYQQRTVILYTPCMQARFAVHYADYMHAQVAFGVKQRNPETLDAAVAATLKSRARR